jgi:tyrosine-protein phosphatase SIW14
MKNATLLTLLILTLTGVPAGAQPGQVIPKKDVPNFGKVVNNIYRGAAPTKDGLKKLKEMGVKTVIDLRIEKKGQKEEELAVKQLGLNRIRIPMGREAPTKAQIATFMKAMENAGNSPVFVHCQHGADRTGAMIGIYRVTKQGWTFDQTWKEMRKYGFKTFLSELKGSVKSRAAK